MLAISGLGVDYNSNCTENNTRENAVRLRHYLRTATRALVAAVGFGSGKILSPTLVL